jgi:hypothetical protein
MATEHEKETNVWLSRGDIRFTSRRHLATEATSDPVCTGKSTRRIEARKMAEINERKLLSLKSAATGNHQSKMAK